MKPNKILLFIIIIIATLALIVILFPSNGIRLFSKTLRFPFLNDILIRNHIQEEDPEETLNQWNVYNKNEDTALETKRKDTVKYLETILKKMEGSFELPNGNLSYFVPFFQKAEAARAEQKIVRVMYYGDSQIELDRFSSNLRQFFQEKFGGGGPGMAPFIQTIPSGALNQSYSGDFTCFSLWGEVHKNKTDDYGPFAKMYKIDGQNSFSAKTLSKKEESNRRDNYSNISLLINNMNGDFKAELTDNMSKIKYPLETDSLGIQLLEFPLNFSTQSFTISMNGSAYIYGILIDNGFGVAVDNIAMRGANGLHFTSMNDSLMHIIYKLLDVEMIVLQYGGNAVPGLSGENSVAAYVNNIILQIKYLQRVAPNIPILFVGPSDMLSIVDGELKTYRDLPYLVEKLSNEIPKSGAAFWNMYQVMGGANSMRAWVKKGWAGNDYVHFTSKGAHEIANVLTQTFEAMYEHYRIMK
ncbi:MAG: hypothetical protein LBU83_00030 [Bacteroidales bacterium]|jgi:hypothetical protein|nr:hypothetical protein [Bacteroidales bacterium]